MEFTERGCVRRFLWSDIDGWWHSFRHTVSAWGKEAGFTLEEVKTLLRHENIATTSQVYGAPQMEAKRELQRRLVEFVKQQAELEGWKPEKDLWADCPTI